MRIRHNHDQSGFILVTVMFLVSVLLILLGSYYQATSYETASTYHSMSSSSGFFAAEASLNLRAEAIRSRFIDYNVPQGTSPTNRNACQGSNIGSGDFRCIPYNFNRRQVQTWVEVPSAPVRDRIPRSERFGGLYCEDRLFTTHAEARGVRGDVEADLELMFKSRTVPLFQFAAFYNKDLEILPGPTMTLSGPVHNNGDIYLYSSSSSLKISGQVTAANSIYRGRKDGTNSPSCNNRPVIIPIVPGDASTEQNLITSCPSRYKTTKSDVAPWRGTIEAGVPRLDVPRPAQFDATPGSLYWDRADIRLVLSITGSGTRSIQVRGANDAVDAAAGTQLAACAGTTLSGKAVGDATIWSDRENGNVALLDVDMQGLLNCLHTTNWFGTGKTLADTTDGGLVLYLTVKGPNSANARSLYGVRLRNGAVLQSSVVGAPLVQQGITVVSDQAGFIMGNYNRSPGKIPAAFMADSMNVLSATWADYVNPSANPLVPKATGRAAVAANMEINTAFLAGTDSTGGIEGVAGQGGGYNGGLENYPRFHENWSGRTLTYRGSFVSLGTPRHATGSWSNQIYSPPARDWNYDVSFNDSMNLPPITPRFVYLRQELFLRDFDRTDD